MNVAFALIMLNATRRGMPVNAFVTFCPTRSECLRNAEAVRDQFKPGPRVGCLQVSPKTTGTLLLVPKED